MEIGETLRGQDGTTTEDELDTTGLTSNRISGYELVSFRNDSSRPNSRSSTPNLENLMELQEEEKAGFDDLLKRSLRNSSCDETHSPSPSPNALTRSRAISMADRHRLSKIRDSVISKVPNRLSASGTFLQEISTESDSARPDSDSSMDGDRWLNVNQSCDESLSDVPSILLSKATSSELKTTPKLRRKNASRVSKLTKSNDNIQRVVSTESIPLSDLSSFPVEEETLDDISDLRFSKVDASDLSFSIIKEPSDDTSDLSFSIKKEPSDDTSDLSFSIKKEPSDDTSDLSFSIKKEPSDDTSDLSFSIKKEHLVNVSDANNPNSSADMSKAVDFPVNQPSNEPPPIILRRKNATRVTKSKSKPVQEERKIKEDDVVLSLTSKKAPNVPFINEPSNSTDLSYDTSFSVKKEPSDDTTDLSFSVKKEPLDDTTDLSFSVKREPLDDTTDLSFSVKKDPLDDTTDLSFSVKKEPLDDTTDLSFSVKKEPLDDTTDLSFSVKKEPLDDTTDLSFFVKKEPLDDTTDLSFSEPLVNVSDANNPNFSDDMSKAVDFPVKQPSNEINTVSNDAPPILRRKNATRVTKSKSKPIQEERKFKEDDVVLSSTSKEAANVSFINEPSSSTELSHNTSFSVKKVPSDDATDLSLFVKKEPSDDTTDLCLSIKKEPLDNVSYTNNQNSSADMSKAVDFPLKQPSNEVNTVSNDAPPIIRRKNATRVTKSKSKPVQEEKKFKEDDVVLSSTSKKAPNVSFITEPSSSTDLSYNTSFSVKKEPSDDATDLSPFVKKNPSDDTTDLSFSIKKEPSDDTTDSSFSVKKEPDTTDLSFFVKKEPSDDTSDLSFSIKKEPSDDTTDLSFSVKKEPSDDTTDLSSFVKKEPSDDTTDLSFFVKKEPSDDTSDLSFCIKKEPSDDTTDLSFSVKKEPSDDTTDLSSFVKKEPSDDTTDLSFFVKKEPSDDTTDLSLSIKKEPLVNVSDTNNQTSSAFMSKSVYSPVKQPSNEVNNDAPPIIRRKNATRVTKSKSKPVQEERKFIKEDDVVLTSTSKQTPNVSFINEPSSSTDLSYNMSFSIMKEPSDDTTDLSFSIKKESLVNVSDTNNQNSSADMSKSVDFPVKQPSNEVNTVSNDAPPLIRRKNATRVTKSKSKPVQEEREFKEDEVLSSTSKETLSDLKISEPLNVKEKLSSSIDLSYDRSFSIKKESLDDTLDLSFSEKKRTLDLEHKPFGNTGSTHLEEAPHHGVSDLKGNSSNFPFQFETTEPTAVNVSKIDDAIDKSTADTPSDVTKPHITPRQSGRGSGYSSQELSSSEQVTDSPKIKRRTLIVRASSQTDEELPQDKKASDSNKEDKDSGDDGHSSFSWKRRPARRVVKPTIKRASESESERGESVSGDDETLQKKRERARAAAKRFQNEKGMSKSRVRREREDDSEHNTK